MFHQLAQLYYLHTQPCTPNLHTQPMPANASQCQPMIVRTYPSFEIERRLQAQGHRVIAGVDEVGRGPLAGPVLAAAVILDHDHIPDGLDDSKRLSDKQRLYLFDQICQRAHFAIASLPAEAVDRVNIRQASLLAMRQAVCALAIQPDYCLIDGRDIPDCLPAPATAIIKGDRQSVSIAAASIIAKVTRDRMMIEAARFYPAYDFDQHKGYGSSSHRAAIATLGPCPLHRYSFSPVRSMSPEARATKKNPA